MTDIQELLNQIERADLETVPLLVHRLIQDLDISELDSHQALRTARALSVHGGPQQLPVAGELAIRAHRADLPGAGVLFAECADKLALMSGRPQRFGTAAMEHQGDIVMGPLDGLADDAMRGDFGLPPLGTMRDNIHHRNLELARQRAHEKYSDSNQPFFRVWTDPTEEELTIELDKNPSGVWSNGNILTFASRSHGAGLMPGPVFEIPMWRVSKQDGSATDLFCAQIYVDRLDEAVFGFGFWELDDNGLPIGGVRGSVDERFRGVDAPIEALSHEDENLRGVLLTTELNSLALRENRKIKVYLPPGHDPSVSLPVIYSTDGNMIAPYIRRLDAAIHNGIIDPVVVVAPHSAPMDRSGNQRALEYLPGFDDQRFDRHQKFFVDELPIWAEETFGASNLRKDKAIFGCSDGAGHALATSALHKERFGHCIAFSSGMPPGQQIQWVERDAPFVHLCAGTLEAGFHQATEAWAAWLHFNKSDHHWTERVCGHDLIQWIEELPLAIKRAWN